MSVKPGMSCCRFPRSGRQPATATAAAVQARINQSATRLQALTAAPGPGFGPESAVTCRNHFHSQPACSRCLRSNPGQTFRSVRRHRVAFQSNRDSSAVLIVQIDGDFISPPVTPFPSSPSALSFCRLQSSRQPLHMQCVRVCVCLWPQTGLPSPLFADRWL